MNNDGHKHRTILERIAHQAMLDRGLLPDFSEAALAELATIEKSIDSNKTVLTGTNGIRDLRNLLWASIDNDNSRDLDQLSSAEALSNGNTKIMVAVADVDALVKIGTSIDDHAEINTTSVYTAAKIFPMLPEKLSTDLTSLNLEEDRLAIVIEMEVENEGSLVGSDIYETIVRNKAQLAYNSVAAWLEGATETPEEIIKVAGLAENLRLQDQIAQNMKQLRHQRGALSLEMIESKPRFADDQVQALDVEEKNRAKEIVEDFMIAANGVVARFLELKGYPSIRRVVRTPKRWERIVDVAAERGFKLPGNPDARKLEEFLNLEKAGDPLRFPDLSLVIIKLLGAGEYVAEFPGDSPPGHFGLAVKDYTHSTAPNRRFTDLITHRLLKAALTNSPPPYTNDELKVMAEHCTEAENAANKVERQVEKSAAALLLEFSHRGAVRCHCHRRSCQGHLGQADQAAHRRPAGGRF